MDNSYLENLIKRQNDAVQFTKNNNNRLLYKVVIPLSVAGSKTINIQGNYIYAVDTNNIADTVNIQFSRQDSLSDSFELVKGFGHIHPFDRLFVTWDAQTDGSITLYVANLAPELMGIIDNRSEVIQNELLQDILTALESMMSYPSSASIINVFSSLSAGNSVDMYTVPANKTFYCDYALVDASNSTCGDNGYIRIETDDSQYIIGAKYDGSSNTAFGHVITFPKPFIVPAGKKIVLASRKTSDDSLQNVYAIGIIRGYLV